MTPLPVVLNAATWFGLGLIVGLVVGVQWPRMRRQVWRLSNPQAQEEPVASHEADDNTPGRPRRWPRRILDVVVILAFISSAVQAYVTYEQLQESADRIQAVVDCQRAYSTGFADALEARQPAAAAEKSALVKWVTTIDELITQSQPDPIAGRQRFATATRDYLQKQAELERTQKEKPYPPFPRDVCG